MAMIINTLVIITRYLLALVFLVAGASMMDQYALAHAYMVSMGLPGALLPWFILVVIAGAVALIAGSSMQWAALAMALLAVTSALLLPEGFDENARTAAFFRNITVASVLLLLAGCWSRGRRASRADRSMQIKHNLLMHRSQQQ